MDEENFNILSQDEIFWLERNFTEEKVLLSIEAIEGEKTHALMGFQWLYLINVWVFLKNTS